MRLVRSVTSRPLSTSVTSFALTPSSSTTYAPATALPLNRVSDGVSLAENESAMTRRPVRDRNGVAAAKPCAIRGLSESGERLAATSGSSVSAMNCGPPAPSSRTGPVNSSPIGAFRVAATRADSARARATRSTVDGRS